MDAHAEKAKQQAKSEIRDKSEWIEKLARFGYFAKGVVYALTGGLALQAAFGTGGRTTGSSGALQTLVNQPFGKYLLALIGIGLVGYAIWRIVEGIMDPENKGSDLKGIGQRIGYIAIGVAYGSLAFTAFQLMMGSGGGGGNSTQTWVGRIMTQPYGRWLVGIGGLIIIGAGIYQLYEGWQATFKRRLKLNELSNEGRKWVERVGRLGFIARGVVFFIMGVFIVVAAYQAEPSEARGMGGALQTLAEQPYGPWLLGLVALGLVAYGIYSVVAARYRYIRVE